MVSITNIAQRPKRALRFSVDVLIDVQSVIKASTRSLASRALLHFGVRTLLAANLVTSTATEQRQANLPVCVRSWSHTLQFCSISTVLCWHRDCCQRRRSSTSTTQTPALPTREKTCSSFSSLFVAETQQVSCN
jgi:hypothetical protein